MRYGAHGMQLVDGRVDDLASARRKSLLDFHEMRARPIDDGARNDGANTGAAVLAVARNCPRKHDRVALHALIDVNR
jgi:hypothetical protein